MRTFDPRSKGFDRQYRCTSYPETPALARVNLYAGSLLRRVIGHQPIREELKHPLRYIRLVRSEAVSCPRQIQHFELLVRFDQGIDQP